MINICTHTCICTLCIGRPRLLTDSVVTAVVAHAINHPFHSTPRMMQQHLAELSYVSSSSTSSTSSNDNSNDVSCEHSYSLTMMPTNALSNNTIIADCYPDVSRRTIRRVLNDNGLFGRHARTQKNLTGTSHTHTHSRTCVRPGTT